MLAIPVAAQADLASLKASCRTTDAVDGRRSNAIQIPYRYCDDGVPRVGGRTPNEGAVRAVAVPQRYDGYNGLPDQTRPDPDAGADSRGRIALDVNVALPDRARHPRPLEGYPLIVLLHGCCPASKADWHGTIDARGEKWHHTDAWFAARGYVVLSYTSRGFVDGDGRGSTGEAQLGHRAYEVNDLQYLTGLLAEDPFFGVNPQRVVVSGASYGGGVAWLALTDPKWRSPRRAIDMRLAAVAPKYGWTDLAHALVPNGVPKRSLLRELFASGVVLPPEIEESFACLTSSTPFASDPFCSQVPALLDPFTLERSAHLQQRFLARIAFKESWQIPVFSAGSLSDQLFPLEEHLRMAEALRSRVPDYPIQEHYGDYGHFAQSKPKEWGDLCRNIHRVCAVSDYRRGFNRRPTGIARLGATTRLNQFIDHYAKPPGNPRAARPGHGVTIALQTCRQNADRTWQPDEPGERFSAAVFGELAENRWLLDLTGEQETTADVSPNPHADTADPVANAELNGGECVSHRTPAGEGVATYDSEELAGDITMIGRTQVNATVQGAAAGVQLNARLYEVFQDGTQVLVDRGVHALADESGTVVFDLHGNGWRFREGHRVRIELAQDDDPYVRMSDQSTGLTVTGVRLALPIRELAPGDPGDAGPDVNLRVTPRAGGVFGLAARSPTGERYAIADFEFFVVDDAGDLQPLGEPQDSRSSTYTGTAGVNYTFAARAIDRRGVSGPLAFEGALAR